jgi:hypothetical protein
MHESMLPTSRRPFVRSAMGLADWKPVEMRVDEAFTSWLPSSIESACTALWVPSLRVSSRHGRRWHGVEGARHDNNTTSPIWTGKRVSERGATWSTVHCLWRLESVLCGGPLNSVRCATAAVAIHWGQQPDSHRTHM